MIYPPIRNRDRSGSPSLRPNWVGLVRIRVGLIGISFTDH